MSRSLFLVFLLMVACTHGIDWSNREIRNGELLLASLNATSEAARLANRQSDTPDPVATARIVNLLRKALSDAAQVDDTVLDKLHHQLQPKLRFDYQRALGQMIRGYETGDPEAIEAAATKLKHFFDWYRDTQYQFRWWKGVQGN